MRDHKNALSCSHEKLNYYLADGRDELIGIISSLCNKEGVLVTCSESVRSCSMYFELFYEGVTQSFRVSDHDQSKKINLKSMILTHAHNKEYIESFVRQEIKRVKIRFVRSLLG